MDVGIDVDIGDAPDDSLQQNEERGDREVRDEHEHRVDDEGYRQKDLKQFVNIILSDTNELKKKQIFMCKM